MSSSSSPGSTLALLPVTEEDLPVITKLWYASMPPFEDIWPNTPAGHAWWDAANLAELDQPNRHYLKVVDTAADNRLIAYGKWDFAVFAEERGGPRFPPWCIDSKPEAGDKFVASLESERKRLCGDAPSYCTCNRFQPLGDLELLSGCIRCWSAAGMRTDQLGPVLTCNRPRYASYTSGVGETRSRFPDYAVGL